MKKAIYSALSLVILWENYCMAAPVPASAGPSQVTSSSYFNEARIGFGLAGEYINAEANLKMEPAVTLENIGSNQSQVAKKLQLAPCFEFGKIIGNNYYVGILFSWRYSGAKNTSRSPIKRFDYFSHEFKINHYTDIMIKPGFRITNRSMVYGLIGPSIANWTHTSNQFGENNAVVDRFETKKTSIGLGIGLGFEYLFEKNYALSFDYTHHFHKSESSNRFMKYQDEDVLGLPFFARGNMKKKVQPSYGVLAARFTVFFNL